MGSNKVNFSFFKTFNIFLILRVIYLYITRFFFNFFNSLFKNNINNISQSSYRNIKNQNSIISIISSSSSLIILDYLLLKLTLYYNKKDLITKFNINYRLNQVSWNFYKIDNINDKLNLNFLINSVNSGLRSLWLILRFWIIGIVLFLLSAYYLLYIRALPINKIVFEWILIVMFVYWLMSGFVFFIKKYQYSKFTSVIQRFWKRSYILFWLIETGVFLVFFYLTINSSNEPVYMYDQIRPLKAFLFSWRLFLLKIFPVIFIILLGYFLHLSLKWNLYNKQSAIVLAITLIIIYIVWLEFYQFFHIINFYGNLFWVYDADEFLWNLEVDFRRTRLQNNYIAMCLMAKFWHLIFIFVFWVFFILRVSETSRIRYPLLVANLQNFIILYIMSWLYMLPWLKFAFRKHLSINYYWFASNFRQLGLRVFFYDIKLFFYSLLNNSRFNNLFSFDKVFFYWHGFNLSEDFNQYKNNSIRDYFILLLQS
jgi:hypothetical protein